MTAADWRRFTAVGGLDQFATAPPAVDPRVADTMRVIGNALAHAPAVAARFAAALSDAIAYRAMAPEGIAADCRACEKGFECDEHPADAAAVADYDELARQLGLILDTDYDVDPVPDPGPVRRCALCQTLLVLAGAHDAIACQQIRAAAAADARYAAAVAAADPAMIAAWLTSMCTECGLPIGTMSAADRDAHVITTVAGHEVVIVGCEGFLIISPAAVGLDAPNWQDWTTS